MDVTIIVIESFRSAAVGIGPLLVKLLLALVLLVIGLLIGKGLGDLTAFIFKSIQLDKGAKQVGFNKLLDKGDIKRTASELLGDLVYWIVVFISVIGVGELFGLAVKVVLAKLLIFSAVVLLAAVILGIGLFLATLISAIVRTILVNLGIEGGKTASRVIYYIVVVFTFLAALAELGVNPDVFVPQIGVIIGAFGLAAAIAFGLGCKDIAADFLSNLFKGK